MSNLYSGKPPFSSGDQGNKDGRRADAPGTSPFARRDDPAGGDGASRPNLGRSGAPTFGARADAPRPPLFSPREAPKAPLFPPRDAAPAAGNPPPGPRAPLFPPRTTPAGGTSAAAARPEAPRAPLFPARSDAPRAPLFPPRPAAPAGTETTPTACRERPALFSRREPAPTPGVPTGTTPSLFSRPAPAGGAAPVSPFGAAVVRRDAKVTDEEFVQLRDFLYQQSGIYIAENRKYLVENRLGSRLRELGLRSFGEYYNYLRYDAGRSAEMNKLFESMTTNETSFFRNGPQLDVFRDKVLIPVLNEQRAKGQKKLRIWSAGCSSGEEPYTLAMILHEVLKQDVDNWDIKITANDLSLAVLASARRGMYNDYAIRTTPADMLARYFTKEGNLYRIDPRLQKLVSFSQINLKDKLQLQKVERSQIVFCRNVIIYFDDEMKKSVINAFYDNLLPGGYLIIGHSESLHNISRAFKPEHYAGSIIYCKQS